MGPIAARLGPLALLAAASAGCGSDRPATAAPEARSAAPRAREVRVVPAALRHVPRTIVVTGTLAADEQVVHSFKVPGRIVELGVDLGSPVHRGQVIARLDPTDFRLRLQQAEAALQQARVRLGLAPDGTDDRVEPEQTALVRQARAVLDEARLTRDRMQRLWEQQLVARAQLDAAVSAFQVAEARYQDALEEVRDRQAVLSQRRTEVALARQQLADTVLAAAVDGIVRERRTSVGEFLAAGTPVATVVRVHPLRLRVAVPERDAASVRPGQVARVTVEGDPSPAAGRVVRLSPSIEEQNRSLVVEAEVANEQRRIRPGAFARAEIVVEPSQPAVVVPASAVVTFAGVQRVITVADGRAVEKRVELGRRLGDEVEVVSGLRAGEPVVVEPGSLVGGQPVTVVR